MEWSDYLPPLTVRAGLSCLVGQILFSCLFAYVLPQGPWTKLPSLTAHQLVCLPLMIFLLYQGILAWFTEKDELYAQGMEGRIFGVLQRGVDMGSIVWGIMLFWDLPMSFVEPALQDPLMIMHHFGMCFVSGVSMGLFSSGQPVASYYAPFFFGLIEISSVFLAIVDLFHPKNVAWFEWVNTCKSPVGDVARTVNELSRVLFALSYLVVRCGFFPYVVFSTCLSDFWQAATLPDEARHEAPRATIWAMFALCLGFTLLQLNWGVLVAKQVAKALGLIPDKKKKETKKVD